MRRRIKQLEPNATINLTSLLDLAFTLLLAFMMVAPTLKHGLEIELPKVEGTSISTTKPYDITIRAREAGENESKVYLNEHRVDLDELMDKLQSNYQRDPEINVIIDADKGSTYEDFARVLGAVKKSGVQNIGIATEAESPKSDQ